MYMMSDTTKLIFVEHHVQDAEGYSKVSGEMMDKMRAAGNVDSGLSDPMFGGNQCLLTVNSTDGKFAACIWQVPADTSMADFQKFIDGLLQGTCTNNPFPVQGTFGINRLDARTYMSDMINIAKTGEVGGFQDASQLWFVHHSIPDSDKWTATVMGIFASHVKNSSNNPSDVNKMFDTGYGGVITLQLGENDTICLWSAPEDTTESNFQAMVDRFTEGTAENTIAQIDHKHSMNTSNLSEDQYNVDVYNYYTQL